MSWLGFKLESPVAGIVQLFDDIINVLDSACPFKLRGKWIPIWSPSKSALNAAHTSGCNFIDFFFVKIGWKDWIPILCRVGARFSNTG